jgi:hypothetical protein
LPGKAGERSDREDGKRIAAERGQLPAHPPPYWRDQAECTLKGERQSEKMQEPQGRQERLVHDEEQPRFGDVEGVRLPLGELGDEPERHAQDAERHEPPGPTLERRAVARPLRGHEAEDQQELPGEGVEMPGTLGGPGRERDLVGEAERVEGEGGGERGPAAQPRDQDEDRRQRQHHHIERQDVEIAKLVGQHDPADDARDRGAEESAGAVPFEEQRVVEIERRRRDHGECDRRDDELRPVDLDHAGREPHHHLGRGIRAARAACRERQRPPGQEHEQLGRVRDRVAGIHEGLEQVARHVVHEDRDEGEPAPEVDRIGFAHSRRCSRTDGLAPVRPSGCHEGRRRAIMGAKNGMDWGSRYLTG